MLSSQSGPALLDPPSFSLVEESPADLPSRPERAGMGRLERILDSSVSTAAVETLPGQFALKHGVLPLQLDGGMLRLAISDPLNLSALDEAAFLTGLGIDPVVAPAEEIRRLAERFYMPQVLRDEAGGEEIEIVGGDETEIGDLQRLARDAVVVQWVNMLLRDAVQDRASDVHIEPFESGLRVRYRVDGVLYEVQAPPRRLQAAIVSRVKIMASLDIAERRLPQDGRLKLRVAGKEVDLRVSTVPTSYGESVVLRILERSNVMLGLEQLGMLEDDRQVLERLLSLPHGIILVTGPTGSGKTTTLYAALQRTYSVTRKIITIEDPVEYQLEGINQIQVRPKIGLTFANGLRHILRQDPDVIMVGEIRDAETAEIAIHAALTGHLVFSTLHTNDAAGAVVRLLEMGIEPFLVASSVEGILAQRLVRTLCPRCSRGEERPTIRLAGCEECRFSGYRGRSGIFQLLPFDEELGSLVMSRATGAQLNAAGAERGMRTLLADGMRKVDRGITTLEEVARVTRTDAPALV